MNYVTAELIQQMVSQLEDSLLCLATGEVDVIPHIRVLFLKKSGHFYTLFVLSICRLITFCEY